MASRKVRMMDWKPDYYIEHVEPGSSIRWGNWSDRRDDRYTTPITLFPYSSGSDYSGNTVEQSNYRVLLADEHVMSRSVEIHGGHSTFGVAFIGYPTRRIREILSGLDGYPLIDESDLSELEMEIEQREWADWGCDEFRREIDKEFEVDLLDVGVDDKTLSATWWSFSGHHGDGGRVFEAPDSCHFYIDDALEWLTKTRRFVSEDGMRACLVLGSVEYRRMSELDIARDMFYSGRFAECYELLKEMQLIPVALDPT
jgi:hypothetical protein